MNWARVRQSPRFFSLIAFFSVTFVALMPARAAAAAELVMFERPGCAWCEVFDREVAPIYPKTEEGRRAPLRRVTLDVPLPSELSFIRVERLVPVFVLIDKGHEIGRIRGYPGEDNFWGLLDVLIKKIDAGTGDERARVPRKLLYANG
jgi:hypothetical protein